MTDTKTEWYFIVNPRAGSGKTMASWIPAEKRLDELSVPYVIAMTDHKRHAVTLAYDAACAGYRRIVAVGGDGSLHEAFNGIMKYCDESGCNPEDFTLGVAPIGSGNDWIRSLGLPDDTCKIIDLIAADAHGTMDVMKVTGSRGRITYFANIAGIGFDSRVCARVNEIKERGYRSPSIYLQALLKTVITLRKINVQIIVDGNEKFSGEAFSIAFGNGCYSGGGMRQVPHAKMDDGLLDYMIVPVLPLGYIMRMIPKLFTGKITEVPQVVSGQCHCFQIIPLDSNSTEVFEEDGEIEGRMPAKFEVDGRKIGIIKG